MTTLTIRRLRFHKTTLGSTWPLWRIRVVTWRTDNMPALDANMAHRQRTDPMRVVKLHVGNHGFGVTFPARLPKR